MSSGNVPRVLRVLVVAAFLLGLVLGWIGFLTAADDKAAPSGEKEAAAGADSDKPKDKVPASAWQRGFDAAHSTLQLIVLNVEADKTQGPVLGVARVILPAAASIAILLFLIEQGRTWIVLGALRARQFVRPRPDIVAVIGCGRSGLALARYYRACGLRVIGLEKDLESTGARRFRGDGFIVADFDFMGKDALDQFSWWTVNRVVVSTGNDLADMELARALLKGCITPPRQSITVSVDSAAPQRAAEFDPLMRRHTNHCTFLDLRVHTARLLLRDFAPHVLWEDRYAIDRDNPCHVVLSMQGQDLDAYVFQAARALVYCPRNPLRITVLTENAAEVKARLLAAYPALGAVKTDDEPQDDAFGGQAPVAQLRVVDSSPHQIDVVGLHDAQREQPIDVIYVKGRSDAETVVLLAEAVKAAGSLPGRRPAIVAGLHERPEGDRAIVDRGEGNAWAATGLRVEACWLDAWLAPDAAAVGSAAQSPERFNDANAMWFHAQYRELPADHDIAAREELWAAATEVERWFNRLSADHADVKLALLRCGDDPGDLAAAVEKHLTALAELEHRRYVCERLLDGWIKVPDATPGAGTKNNLFHLNPTLRAFGALAKQDKDKDLAFASGVSADMLKHRRAQQASRAGL